MQLAQEATRAKIVKDLSIEMCGNLFSQLCLKIPTSTAVPCGDPMRDGKSFSCTDWNLKTDMGECFFCEQSMEEAKRNFGKDNNSLMYETSSMAALVLRGQAIGPMQIVARVPVALFYWPSIQLAGAATDNIASGVSIGSKGMGNLPGATLDIRSTLLLLLIGKCTADRAAFQAVGGEEFFGELLCRYLFFDSHDITQYDDRVE